MRCLFTKPVEFDSLSGMSGSILTSEDRAHFLWKIRHLTPSLVHRRMNALLLLDDGWAAERVADVLFIDAETVREHRRRYQVGGVAGVEQLNRGAERLHWAQDGRRQPLRNVCYRGWEMPR